MCYYWNVDEDRELSDAWTGFTRLILLKNTVFIRTSRKPEIARSVRGPKLQGSRAEDALAEPYLVQKIW